MQFDTILDEDRLEILPNFKNLPEEFYLSGGTALALQLGHRISVDFDFFSSRVFDTQQLYEKLSYDVFKGNSLTIVQEAENTLDILTDKQVKISFLRYRYKPIYPLIQTPFFKIADVLDIGASKLIAIAQRASQKDFFDLYFILKRVSLETLFDAGARKYPTFNPILYLKALTYYDDCDSTTPRLVLENVGFDEVKRVLTREAQALFTKLSK
ncbi:MAG: nucleotidyl transferase AbiEii/AbiGii toxin family protein [Proteobacteria bacterium]|nr:nucleotidyl transferase AbiEii/AbiGii toxin family protein [Pseudomonadota bacterium]